MFGDVRWVGFLPPLSARTNVYETAVRSPYENKTHLLTKKSANHMEIVTFVRKYSVPLVSIQSNFFLFLSTVMILKSILVV